MLMVSSHAPRLLQQLACVLFATVASATISPSNSSTAGGQFQGTLPLKHADGNQAKIADLVPLTRQAVQQTIEGNLYNANFSNAGDITVGEIAFISCDAGVSDPQRVFEDAYRAANISGVILYSTTSDFCNYEQNNNQQMLEDFPVFSMTNRQASASLLASSLAAPFAVLAQVQGDGNTNTNNNNGGFGAPQNPLGPSPSTAVAMIILYSITGIITALFLVIIITGAIRAHRHPERYGPRDVLGRPRQSRARGLGRAILDTIPIVKFGEKEPAKPTDIELASTAESRDVNATDAQATQTDPAVPKTNDTAVSTGTAQAVSQTMAPSTEEHQEGIAPAQPAVAADSGLDNSSNDEHLGCSICTEDFEKGQDLRVLPCDHKFHPECVDPWLLNVSGTCPLCRVDLHPVTSHDSSASQDPNETTPPVNTEAETLPHRSAFRDILSLRHRPNATPQERIYYLRRLREQRRNRSGNVADEPTASNEDPTDRRRSKRMSARLSGVFGGRARRERSPTQQGESSRSAPQSQPPSDEPPVPDRTPGTDARQS